MKTDSEPGAEHARGGEELRVGLWFGTVVAAANAAAPWIATLEGVSLSSRSVSARFLVAMAGIVVALIIWFNSRLRADLPWAPIVAVVLFSLVALSTTAWGDLGPGTIGLGLVMLIPTLAKLLNR